MKKFLYPTLLVLMVMVVSCKDEPAPVEKIVTPVSFSEVTINDNFWAPRLKRHKEATIPVCIDQIENQTGRMRNFKNAALREGQHSGIFFDDSDVYKALEGMAYSLQNNPDEDLEQKCDEWIDKFAAAQMDDGYLNTFYTLTGLDGRWQNMDRHEMYCAGHMIEAAVAYYKVTGKRKLVDVCERFVQHMMSVFGPEGRHWVPGHEEIELALVKLYEITGKQEYLDFASWLLEERGHGYGSYGNSQPWPAHYYQDEVPVSELEKISGHAVRSMYLFCGMADVAAYTGNTAYRDALDRVWDDVVLRNMYITGGIGQSASNEGFTTDYSLPNKTAYCETCASVGMVLWNWRMNQFTGDARYIDVLERSLYNGALAGISLSGDRFFYVNPLESDGGHHRQAWYGCACCPSQICRFLPSIGNYIYGLSDDALWVNLFIGNTSKRMTIKTEYPWDGHIELTVGELEKKEIRIRIPDWSEMNVRESNGSVYSYTIESPSRPVKTKMVDGYLCVRPIKGGWTKGDKLVFDVDMPVKIVAADPRVKEDEGMRAVQCGPIVYCMEKIDNNALYDNTLLTADTEFRKARDPYLLGGVQLVFASNPTGSYTFIPYYAWDNRAPSPMRVWVPFEE